MRNNVPLIFVVAFTLTGCAFVPRDRPWSFVAAVGGIAVEQPVRTSNGVTIPVRADVSGLTAVTMQPTTMNSALACSATHAKISGQDILLTIATTLARSGSSPLCPPAHLGSIPAGKYNVLYGDDANGAMLLGEVYVSAKPEHRSRGVQLSR